MKSQLDRDLECRKFIVIIIEKKILLEGGYLSPKGRELETKRRK